MAVTGSTFTLEGAQADGSRWCRELHTITGGAVVDFYYLAPASADNNAIMTARVAVVNLMIADNEAAVNMDRDGALTLLQQTGTQFMTRLRDEMKSKDRDRACYLAWWLLRRIAAGNITDAQCQTAWGLSGAQWTTIKTNTLTPRSDAYATTLAAVGV